MEFYDPLPTAMGIAQAGMIRRKNSLSMLMQTLVALSLRARYSSRVVLTHVCRLGLSLEACFGTCLGVYNAYCFYGDGPAAELVVIGTEWFLGHRPSVASSAMWRTMPYFWVSLGSLACATRLYLLLFSPPFR